MVLFLISFIAGVLTVLAPCVLPLLPVVVGGSLAGGSSRRAITISVSLGISVVLFTLLLKASTAFIGVPQSAWERISGAILILFGLVMLFPQLWDRLGFVQALNRGSNKLLATGYRQNSLWGDVVMGAALGPVFSSCSPTYFVILATVLPASFLMGIADLVAYALGLSGFLFLIALTGQRLVDTFGVTTLPGGWFRRGIGILFLIVGLAVATGVEAKTEIWLLNHGFDVTFIEQRLLGAPSGSGTENPTERANEGTGESATSSAHASFLSPRVKADTFRKAPELAGIDGYLNTGGRPITLSQFKGKNVVLVDFWTYSCINCLRTIPYLTAWYQKYKQKGLVVIGVHTPEFAFEHVEQNVADALVRLGITYPVVLDNEYATWNAFGNQFWPREYLIDIDGYIVHDHAGEGEYDATEKAIQTALAERMARLGSAASIASSTVRIASPDLGAIQSPETYFGSDRNEYLGNGRPGVQGTQTFALPQYASPNTLYLDGAWDVEPQYAQSLGAAAVEYTYSAHDIDFVASAAAPTTIYVLRDGEPVGSFAGKDVDPTTSTAVIGADRLYNLVHDAHAGSHTIRVKVEGAGLKAYTFTFG